MSMIQSQDHQQDPNNSTALNYEQIQSQLPENLTEEDHEVMNRVLHGLNAKSKELVTSTNNLIQKWRVNANKQAAQKQKSLQMLLERTNGVFMRVKMSSRK